MKKKKNPAGVTERTRAARVRKFAVGAADAWRGLNAFVRKRCSHEPEQAMEAFDDLCNVVDRYVHLNCEILRWCHRNGVDPGDFVCEVMSCEAYERAVDEACEKPKRRGK